MKKKDNFFVSLYKDAKNIQQKDPATKNIFEVILLYPGFHILIFHKIAHKLYNLKMKLLFTVLILFHI